MAQGKPITDYQKKRINDLDDQGLTQREIADYLDIAQPSVNKWLRKPKEKVLHAKS